MYKRQDLHILYVGFKQSFDSVNRKEMLNYIHILGMSAKCVRLIQTNLAGSKSAVRVNKELSTTFGFDTGAR